MFCVEIGGGEGCGEVCLEIRVESLSEMVFCV